MDRQLYGISTLQGREKYGIGSKLKKFVRNIIPNEVAEIAVKAAPFVAPFNPLLAGAMSAIGSFDQTGRIGSSIKSGLINYGLGQAARFAGGAGFQGGIDPFAGYSSAGSFGGLGSLFTSPVGTQTGFQLGQYDFFKPYSGTPTQLDLTGAGTDYGINEGLRTTTSSGIQNLDVSGAGTDYGDTLGARTTSNVPFVPKEPGYVDLIKQAGSLDPNVSISQRFDAVKDLGQKALQDIYTKPIRNAAGEIVDRELDKSALISTAVTASTYADALGLLSKAGDPDPEKTLSEADYQRLRVDPEKSRFASLTPEAFGIRNLSADGGMMNDMQSGVLSITLTPADRKKFQLGSKGRGTSNNRVSQIIQLIRDAESIGDIEKAEELRLDLFRETKKANGGRIGYQMGGLGMESFALTQRPDDLGLPGFDDNPLQNREPTLEEAIARGVIFYDPIAGFQVNPLTGGRMGTGMDPNFIARKAMQAEQDAAARTSPVNVISRGVSSSYLSPNQSMQQDLLMRQGAVQTGGTSRSASEGSSGINPLFRINRLIQAEQDAAARVTPKKANGGRINYFMGSEIPVRQNQGGITELDLRAKGGYIPVGIKEKADDVPAMLSKNEFVFTADAVRGAGKGNINKGAQKMYKLMKSLEKKIKKQKGN